MREIQLSMICGHLSTEVMVQFTTNFPFQQTPIGKNCHTDSRRQICHLNESECFQVYFQLSKEIFHDLQSMKNVMPVILCHLFLEQYCLNQVWKLPKSHSARSQMCLCHIILLCNSFHKKHKLYFNSHLLSYHHVLRILINVTFYKFGAVISFFLKTSKYDLGH